MEKDELKEAEEEVLRALEKDKEYRRPAIPGKKSAPVSKNIQEGIPAASLLGYPGIVGIATLAASLILRQVTAMAFLPLVAFSFFCTFLPGLIAGISERFFRERTVSPVRLAGILGGAMVLVAFFLIYTLPISTLPDGIAHKLYPFGATAQSMMSLGMPASVLGRVINAGTAAAMGVGIVLGMAFSNIISRKV